jgi:arabinose-5-phosphate isomerase
MTVQVAIIKGSSTADLLERGREVVLAEADALRLLADQLDGSFSDACELILNSPGRVVITGMGKSGHIGRKWAATMAATGTPAIYVHPSEAAHGDLGMLVEGDVLLVISNSGNTGELRPFLRYAGVLGVPVVGVASQLDSLVMREATVRLCYPAVREACPANMAPTTSTTMQLALGDALALALMDRRGFSLEGMKTLHPGGSLGLRLMPVRELMHRDMLPLVAESAPMREVLVAMTSGGFGIAGVVDMAGRLAGVITDGDLRRHFEEIATTTASTVMTRTPTTVTADMRAQDVLDVLNEKHITAAFVMEPNAPVNHNVPVGIVHLHDFLRMGLR